MYVTWPSGFSSLLHARRRSKYSRQLNVFKPHRILARFLKAWGGGGLARSPEAKLGVSNRAYFWQVLMSPGDSVRSQELWVSQAFGTLVLFMS